MISEEQRLGLLESYGNATMQSLWSLMSIVKWSGESEAHLEYLERKILANVQHPMQSRYVRIGANANIWTLCFNSSGTHSNSTSPLVLLHGFGTGSALWVLNIDELASTRPVYVLDLLGFGRSSRTTFSDDAAVAELEMVEALELWRREVGLEKFILLGHCFGAFLATSYTLRYPDRIRHLVLAEPWGFGDASAVTKPVVLPLWVRLILIMAQPFNPLAALRMAGVWGPALVGRFKPDLISNYERLLKDDTIAQYIYQCNAPNPTGETAFKHMSHDFGWAVYPMINRIKDIPGFVSMTMIFGSRSWVDSTIGGLVKELRPDSYVDVQIIRGGGHFVFADKVELFNSIVLKACTLVDHRVDSLLPRDRRRRRLRSDSAPNLQALERRARARAAASAAAIGRRSRHNSDCLEEETEVEQGFASAEQELDEPQQDSDLDIMLEQGSDDQRVEQALQRQVLNEEGQGHRQQQVLTERQGSRQQGETETDIQPTEQANLQQPADNRLATFLVSDDED